MDKLSLIELKCLRKYDLLAYFLQKELGFTGSVSPPQRARWGFVSTGKGSTSTAAGTLVFSRFQ